MEDILMEISRSLTFVKFALSIIIGLHIGNMILEAINQPQVPMPK